MNDFTEKEWGVFLALAGLALMGGWVTGFLLLLGGTLLFILGSDEEVDKEK